MGAHMMDFILGEKKKQTVLLKLERDIETQRFYEIDLIWRKCNCSISENQRGPFTTMILSNFYMQPAIPVPTRTTDFVLAQVRTCS